MAKRRVCRAKKRDKTQEDSVAGVDPVFEGMCWFGADNPVYGFGMGERALWRKVVVQALVDFCTLQTTPSGLFNRHTAERWFLKERSFMRVCDYADIPGDVLRTTTQRAAHDPEAMRRLRKQVTKISERGMIKA